MKKIIIVAALFLLSLAPHALAAESGFVALAPITGLTDQSTTALVNSGDLSAFFNNLYKYLIGLAAILAIIQIMYGGIRIATNQDNVSLVTDMRGRIVQALFGLVLVLSPAIVFSIINPRILDLSIGLSPLDLPAPVSRSSDGTSTTTISAEDRTVREAMGGRVVWSFTINNAAQTGRQATGAILDDKQQQCTRDTGGTGIILPDPQTGGGAFAYVCQTCPPNTTMVLLSRGRPGPGPRGACQPN
ncbi:hypothetical protein HYV30_02635 [Candidatus Kaiserbacteria bacterium]|nr:hypothetical protein [Candidatus Kaiserbacteria bacterium]